MSGHLAAWRHGGYADAWNRSLWWSFSSEEKLRKKGGRLAERLFAAKISAKDMEPQAIFHAVDSLVTAKDPTEKEWSNVENKVATRRAWLSFEMALESGASINHQKYNNYCETPLHQAAVGGRSYLTQLLLKHGANPNARDGNGYTPLAATLEGFGEKTGNAENRLATAMLLLEANGTDLNLGKRQRTYYNVSENEVIEYELGLLAHTSHFPNVAIALARKGAPLSWRVPDHESKGRNRIAGDRSTGSDRHALFMTDHDIWSKSNHSERKEWIQELSKKEGDLTVLRSQRGFTPAMEFLADGGFLADGIGQRASNEESMVDKAKTAIQFFIDQGVFNLTDKTDGGSTIWHALFMGINDLTLPKAKALVEHFPETTALLCCENEGGLAPRDMIRHFLEGSEEQIRTTSGFLLATDRKHYGESWQDTLRSLLAIIDRQSLQEHVLPLHRAEPAPAAKPRL